MVIAALQMFLKQEDIYKGRFEELQQEIMIGVEASKCGEAISLEKLK